MLIELSTFRLVHGTPVDEFTAAETDLATEVLYLQPGFVRRTAATNPDGDWLALSVWRSPADADRAAVATASHGARHRFDTMVDRASLVVRRYSTLE